MSVGSGLASAAQASPALAAAAVETALAAAGLPRAGQVLLFLTRDFDRQARAAVVAAARAGGTLQVAGCTASGLFTEAGWSLDQPAAAALVLAPAAASPAGDDGLHLCFTGHARLPYGWQSGSRRAGLQESDAVAWSAGRVAADSCAEIVLPGWRARPAHAPGLHPLGGDLTVDACDAYELRQVDGVDALDSLRAALPAEWRRAPPWHRLALLRSPGRSGIAILSAGADGSLTLGEALSAGDTVRWALRDPAAAEREMRDTLAAAVDAGRPPEFALSFSCIGRGPLFYGGEDRDLQAFRDRCPGVPLLGAYGTGQIVPGPDGNLMYHNSTLTLSYESLHV